MNRLMVIQVFQERFNWIFGTVSGVSWHSKCINGVSRGLRGFKDVPKDFRGFSEILKEALALFLRVSGVSGRFRTFPCATFEILFNSFKRSWKKNIQILNFSQTP